MFLTNHIVLPLRDSGLPIHIPDSPIPLNDMFIIRTAIGGTYSFKSHHANIPRRQFHLTSCFVIKSVVRTYTIFK